MPAPAARILSAIVPCGTIYLQLAALEQSSGENLQGARSCRSAAHATEGKQALDRTGIATAGDGADRKIACTLLDQAVEQRRRNADVAEPAEQNGGTIGYTCHGIRHGVHELVDHWRTVAHGSSRVEP